MKRYKLFPILLLLFLIINITHQAFITIHSTLSMGCVNSSVDNSKNKSLFTEDKYLEHLLNLISSKDELSAMLDPYFIKLIRKYLSKMVWPSDNRNTLVRLLEDYIRFSVHHTYTHTVIELTHYR